MLNGREKRDLGFERHSQNLHLSTDDSPGAAPISDFVSYRITSVSCFSLFAKIF